MPIAAWTEEMFDGRAAQTRGVINVPNAFAKPTCEGVPST